MNNAADPLSLAPMTPFSSWTPMKGNKLISSRFCETLLPPTFGNSALNLAELIDIGLQNNPNTKQTWAMARSAAAQYGQSLSSFYPDIQFTSQYTRAKGTFIDTGDGVIPYFATQAGPDVQLTYTLFDFGQRTSASVAARESLYYADWTHNQEIQTVIQNVIDDYYSYLFQMQLLKANEANLQNACAALDAANQKFSLGLAALGDVAQTRTQYLQNKINLTTQKQNTENAFAQLAGSLGLPANVRFQVQPMPEKIIAEPMLESVHELIEEAEKQRQDLLAAQADLRSKESLVLNAKRAVYPVLATSLDIGKYWFQQGMYEKEPHWSAEVTLNFPLFNGFYYKNGIKKAEANRDQSRAQLIQTELTMIQSITIAHMNVNTSAQNLKDSGEYLQAAQLEFNIALSSYKAGTMTILNVLSAQSSLSDARSKKAHAEQSWFTSLASIAYATGSLCLPAKEEAE